MDHLATELPRGLVPPGYHFEFQIRDLGVSEHYKRVAAWALERLRPAATRGYICPRCGNGSGPNGTGMEFSAEGAHAGHFHCYKCGLHGDIVDIAREMGYGNDTGMQIDSQNAGGQTIEAREYKADADLSDDSTPIPALSPAAAAQAFAGSDAEAYAHSRGLTDETCARFGLGMGYLSPVGAALIIPEASSPGWYVARALDPQAKPKTLNARGPVPLFNAAALKKANRSPSGPPGLVFVVESAICAMSIVQAGYPAAALCGAEQHKALLGLISDMPVFERPILALALDADSAGTEATQKLTAALRGLGCESHDVRDDLYAGSSAKDPNDLLLAGQLSAALARARASLTAITLNLGAGPLLEAQKALDDLILQQPLDTTGLTAIDALLGSLRPGLYVFGALPGTGKTSLLLQFARHLQRTRDVVFYSLEMSSTAIFSRLVSQVSAQLLLPQLYAVQDQPQAFKELFDLRPSAAAIEDIRLRRRLPEEAQRLIQRATDSLGEEIKQLRVVPPGHSRLTVYDLRLDLMRHMQLRGQAPIVIIDYLQYMTADQPDVGPQTDKQAVDQLVSSLKALSLDFGLTIFLISSLNRQNYFNDANLGSFKESGGIEYTSEFAVMIQPWAPDLYVITDEIRGKTEPVRGPDVKRLAAVMSGPRYFEFCLLKARTSESNRILLSFDGRSGSFYAGSHTDRAAQDWKHRAERLAVKALQLALGFTDYTRLRELAASEEQEQAQLDAERGVFNAAQVCIWPLEPPGALQEKAAPVSGASAAAPVDAEPDAPATLFIDLETYSSADLQQLGVDIYVRAPDFRIILLCYALGDTDVQTVDLSQPDARLPDDLLALLADPGVTKVAHNATFELTCLTAAGVEHLDPRHWHDTRLHARYCQYPGSLKPLALALGLPDDLCKSGDGDRLIPRFCKPVRKGPTDLPEIIAADPQAWADFARYCAQDVIALRAVYKALNALLSLPDWLREQWALDYRIQRRGVHIDVPLCSACCEIIERIEAADLPRFAALTGGLAPTQTQKVLAWLRSRGLHQLTGLKSKELEQLLPGLDKDSDVYQVIEMRLDHAKTSDSKYATALSLADDAGVLRGTLDFYAARTGRWKSTGVQLHNMPRPDPAYMDKLSSLRDLAATGDPDALTGAGFSPKSALASLARTILIPFPGSKVLTVCDYAQIEPRVAAWLAGETWRQELLSADGPLYETTAARAFGVSVESVMPGGEHHDLRQIGKIMELSLGYMAGPTRYNEACASSGLGLEAHEAHDHVRRWRRACPHIVAAWHSLSKAANEATATRSCAVAYDLAHQLCFRYQEPSMLLLELPSGRSLCYGEPQVAPTKLPTAPSGSLELTCRRPDSPPGTQRDHLHGGLLLENVVQALSRDILADALARAEAAGLRVLFHVHDEIICDGACLEQLREIMSQSPPWAKGLKLNAAGFEAPWYRKD